MISHKADAIAAKYADSKVFNRKVRTLQVPSVEYSRWLKYYNEKMEELNAKKKPKKKDRHDTIQHESEEVVPVQVRS